MPRPLSTFSLTLLTVGSVDSIRNLPLAALAGNQLFYYFSLAFVLFLLPCTVISVWLSRFSDQGIYGWIKKSLGPEIAALAIWFQWMQNLLIYPTFLAFIAGALLYSLNPALISNKVLVFIIINALIWTLTAINYKGISISSAFNNLCTLLGVLLPFVLILWIGSEYLWHHPLAIKHLPATAGDAQGCLTAIILSFCGMEIAAVHLKDSHPNRFHKANVFAMIIIFISMLFGALTLAFILPQPTLNFISDIPELFSYFFKAQGYSFIASYIILLLVIGSIGCANNWIIAPIKGLSYSSGKPVNHLLLLQAGLISLISCLFLLFSSIKTSYWFMLTLATEMYLLLYFLMFTAAIKLALKHRAKRIIVMSILGLSGITIAFAASIQPPLYIGIANKWLYQSKLLLMMLLFCTPPMVYYSKKSRIYNAVT